MKITTVDTIIEEFRSEYIPLFPHSSVELLVREIERLQKTVEVQKKELERLYTALELIRDSLPKHSGDWCRLIAEEAVGEKESEEE